MKTKTTKAQLREGGWTFTNTFYANCEVWEKGKSRILYDPVIERIIHQYSVDTKDCVRLGSNKAPRGPLGTYKE